MGHVNLSERIPLAAFLAGITITHGTRGMGTWTIDDLDSFPPERASSRTTTAGLGTVVAAATIGPGTLGSPTLSHACVRLAHAGRLPVPAWNASEQFPRVHQSALRRPVLPCLGSRSRRDPPEGGRDLSDYRIVTIHVRLARLHPTAAALSAAQLHSRISPSRSPFCPWPIHAGHGNLTPVCCHLTIAFLSVLRDLHAAAPLVCRSACRSIASPSSSPSQNKETHLPTVGSQSSRR